MKKEIKLFPIAILLLTALLLSSCKDREPLTLTIASAIKIDRSTTENDTNFFGTPLDDFFLTPLVAYDISDTPHPVLLKEARATENEKAWDITIRDGVRFHDGTVLTADDVVFSIDKRREMSSRLAAVVKAEALDKLTLRMTFMNPVQDISRVLGAIYVYQAHTLKQAVDWRKAFLKHPIGSGPYKVERWLDNGIVFSANESYFDGPPRIMRIVYISEDDENRRLTLLLRGESDIAYPISQRAAQFISKDAKFYLNRQPIPYYAAMFLNTGPGVFSDLKMRQAIQFAIDRNDIIMKGIDGAGMIANTPFSDNMLPEGYVQGTHFYHPDEALELLEKAGWRPGKDGIQAKNGKRLRVRLAYGSYDTGLRRVAEIISRQLYEIGIEVETIPVNYSEKLASITYDAYLATAVKSGPGNTEYVWQSRELDMANTINFSDYSNREVDYLLELARKTKDPERIKRIYARIDRLIYDDAPAVFLYTPYFFTAANKRFAGAKGFMGTPYETIGIKDW